MNSTKKQDPLKITLMTAIFAVASSCVYRGCACVSPNTDDYDTSSSSSWSLDDLNPLKPIFAPMFEWGKEN